MHRLLAALVAATALAVGTAAGAAVTPTTSDASSDGQPVLARGVQDAVDPGDETDTAGETTYSPGSPSLANLLVLGPVLGLLVLGAAVLGTRIPAKGDPEAPSGEGPDAPDGGRRELVSGPSEPDAADGPGDPSQGDDPSGGDALDEGTDDADEADEAVALLDEGLPGDARISSSEPGVPRILRLGQRAVEEGNLEAAVEWFETALAADPDLGVAHLCRGLSLEEMGEPEDAADAFHEAAEADPGNVAARYLLARALAEAGRPREALVHLRQVLNLVPELTDVARQDEGFAPLHDDPRFLAALGEL